MGNASAYQCIISLDLKTDNEGACLIESACPCVLIFYRPQTKSTPVKKQQLQKGRKTRKQESSIEEDDDDDDDDDDEDDTPKRQTRRRVAAKVRCDTGVTHAGASQTPCCS